MKATISNNTKSPKGFYLGFKQVTVRPGESIEGDYDDALLQSLKDTGFDVAHKGTLKINAAAPTGEHLSEEAKAEALAIVDAAKAESDKVIAEAKESSSGIVDGAKAEAEKIISEAKSEAEKIISESKKMPVPASSGFEKPGRR
jgi:phosphosulfolactate synthase (CoM biosynthesis protein A)